MCGHIRRTKSHISLLWCRERERNVLRRNYLLMETWIHERQQQQHTHTPSTEYNSQTFALNPPPHRIDASLSRDDECNERSRHAFY
mmetsp:Transcript_7966/g.12180  ORF Transcript_7966/g.12180 Transcript_7966/m.12180 type:complete len:86 (-) Transcript_7966:158-415(-)